MNIEEKKPPDDENGVKDGALSERYGAFLASNLKANSPNQVVKQGNSNTSAQARPQRQASNGNLVFWERFLNVRSIKVLLVENDDSTRYVVTALLRNCNYEVFNAGNGLQAWKFLEDLSNHVDIILTEVVMPVLSGIGLLHKIMTHKTRKNIPVIMMSSHDSMGLVFNCLSKGAVDFLVKPIRKNELKILWQHVWRRRCQSSSGSGSESGTQAGKFLKLNTSERSGDNDENHESNGQNTGDASDDGSGAENSWTKQAVEVESAVSPADRIVEYPDSTCAQFIPSNAEKCENIKELVCLGREGLQQKHPDNVEKNGNKLHMSAKRTVETQSGDPVQEPIIFSARERESDSKTEVGSNININHFANDDIKESSLEISLKRLRGIQDAERYVQEDRFVLRRSEQSAFSRYNTSTNALKPPNEITGSSTIVDNSMEAAKMESVGLTHLRSFDQSLHQSYNGISNTIDMGSTTAKFLNNTCEGTSAINGFPSAFKPVENEVRYSQQQASLPNGDTSAASSSLKHEFQILYEKPQYYNRSQLSSNHLESSSMKMAVDGSLCGSTNALSGPMDVENGFYSFNKSNSGSNHASNGASGSNPNTAWNNAESGVDQAGKSAFGDVSGNRDDERKLKRAAAVIKFCQKRKDRCFKKKVRYQNRKKLAEQRPRVKGQFVKQTEADSSYKTGDEDL